MEQENRSFVLIALLKIRVYCADQRCKINVPALKSRQQFTAEVRYLITAGWSDFWGCYSCVKTKNRDELVLKCQPVYSMMWTQMLSTLTWCLKDMGLEYLSHAKR